MFKVVQLISDRGRTQTRARLAPEPAGLISTLWRVTGSESGRGSLLTPELGPAEGCSFALVAPAPSTFPVVAGTRTPPRPVPPASTHSCHLDLSSDCILQWGLARLPPSVQGGPPHPSGVSPVPRSAGHTEAAPALSQRTKCTAEGKEVGQQGALAGCRGWELQGLGDKGCGLL